MFWTYDTRTYNDCKSWIILSALRHVNHVKAVYSVKQRLKLT